MRYRVKSYAISNNQIVLADPALSALTIEDVRLIVNETTTDENQQVLCSSAQKSSFVSGISTSATGATISFKSGVTIANNDQVTIELDLGDSPSAANSAILTAINTVAGKVDDTKSAVTSAETEIKSTVTSAETQVKNTVTSAETQIKNTVTSAETQIKDTVTSAESQIKTTVITAETDIKLLGNIIREAVMGNVPEFNAASAYSINTLVKYTDTSVTPNVTKVYRIDVAHTAGVTWANTEKSEVSALSVLNEFATGYFVELNDDGVDTYTLNLDKSATVIDNTLNVD